MEIIKYSCKIKFPDNELFLQYKFKEPMNKILKTYISLLYYIRISNNLNHKIKFTPKNDKIDWKICFE